MHVMVIAPEGIPIPPTQGGSVQIYLSHLFRELSKRLDVNVTLVSPGQHAREKQISSHATHMTIRAAKTGYWQQVHKVIRTKRPDVIQIDNRPSQALSIMKAFPKKNVMLNLHSLTFLSKRYISYPDAKRVLHQAKVVCNSADLARAIRSRFQLKSTWKPAVIYPGVAQKQGANALIRRSPHTPLRVLFVGRVIQQKGVHVLINAIRALQSSVPVKLTVVGGTHAWEQAYRAKLKTQSRGLNVKFVGFVPPHKLSAYYQSSDILVCPSQRHEAFGLVNLEAMSHGMPVIASKIGGIPEAVGTEGAILIDHYENPREFAAALRSMMSTVRYKKYSKAALIRARRFTWNRTARALMRLYRLKA